LTVEVNTKLPGSSWKLLSPAVYENYVGMSNEAEDKIEPMIGFIVSKSLLRAN
jgi:hypothetical protein